MHRKIRQLTLPNIVSNITVPLLGMVDVAIAGRLSQGDLAIGAIAIGTTLFNFIYWNCAFLRMGVSGLAAQSLGARNLKECATLLLRGVTIALVLALLLLLLQRYIATLSLNLMFASAEVEAMARRYFFVRIWAAPATISLYAIQGWFIGMQNAKTPMWTSIWMNLINIGVGVWLVFGCHLNIEGIAWATVAAQYSGLLFSLYILATHYKRLWCRVEWHKLFAWRDMVKFFQINSDIFLRTACIVAVFTFFTSISSTISDTALAINSLLMQLFTLYSFMSDGIAYAAESLVGRYLGARNYSALRECIGKLFLWAIAFALLCVVAFGVAWRPLLQLFTSSPTILEGAASYMVWVLLVPIVGFTAFLLDGILIGATQTRTMRNTMFIAMGVYFATYYSTAHLLGNTTIWLAFILFLATRGIAMWIATRGLKSLYSTQSL